jgi:predicted enzyme related to lactoylglutathione lyase
MTHGTIGWVQVGTDDPGSAKRFYGELFDWTFATDPAGGANYELASYAGAERPHGGIFDTEGKSPNHAVFFVTVSDVEATVEQAERLGGKTLNPPTTTPSGLTFAHLQDPAGNHFAVFKPAS